MSKRSVRSKPPLRSLCALVAGAGILLAACGGTSASSTTTTPGARVGSFPVAITAANGVVKIDSRPHAIVSLSPTATEMLYAIGAGRQVKAVDQYSDYPPQAPRTSLNEEDPNVEAIAAYKPDLVIVAGDPTNLTSALAPFGIPVLSDPAATTLQSAYNQYAQLGAATGHVAQAAAEVAKVKAQIAAIVRSVPPTHQVRTYYYELDQTYYSATSATFIGQVLSLLKLTNIADAAPGGPSASGGYPQLSAEFIVKANPDFIFLADTICCGQSPSTVAARPGWSTVRAVVQHHVVKLNDDIASRWGPRIVDLLRVVAAAVDEQGAGGAATTTSAAGG